MRADRSEMTYIKGKLYVSPMGTMAKFHWKQFAWIKALEEKKRKKFDLLDKRSTEVVKTAKALGTHQFSDGYLVVPDLIKCGYQMVKSS